MLRRRARPAVKRHAVVRPTVAAADEGSAIDTPGVDPEAYTCDQPGYIDFEGLPNHYDLSAGAIGGVEFTTTDGYTWEVGDFSSGEYNGKYPEGAYTSKGTNWAWLGVEAGEGRMTFANGPASDFSILVSAGEPVELEAYNASEELLAAVAMGPNIETGTMDELKITRSLPEMAYVVVHGTGNFFLVDSVCTNAPKTYTTPVGGAIGDQMAGNPSMNPVQCEYGAYPVNCATGDFWHTFTDVSIPSRGLPLAVTRTYNSALASADGAFGYGWSSNVAMSASVENGDVTIHQEDGSTVTFEPNGSGEYAAPPSVLATLVEEPDGSYVFTRRKNARYVFSKAGRLIEASERNGNTTTYTYNGAGQLTAETDPSGGAITLAYDADGQIASVTDPEGRHTSYVYDAAGDLVEVIDPLGRHWQFRYDSEHRMVTMREPQYFGDTTTTPSPIVTNTYDSSGRVTAQTDPMGRTTTFDYTSQPGSTVITTPSGGVTDETYADGELVSITKGVGTPQEATWQYTYNPATLGVERVIDPDGDITTNAYDEAGNLIATTNPLGQTTSYTYNEFDESTSETSPLGITTSYLYDEHGNVLEKATPFDETSEVARTIYSYEAEPGEVTAVTDPDGDTTKYGYDAAGNRTSVTDPDGNTTTYAYDTEGKVTSEVAPAGNGGGGDPAAHTTSYSYDADGELISETDPLGHTTSYAYDGDGNRISMTDAAGQTTKQVYNADNELIDVMRPDGSVLVTEWDADGDMTAQIDGAGHATTYAYDPLDRLVSVADPDGHTTSYRYDADGRTIAMIDAEGQTTEYGYDAAGELTSIAYSDGSTPDVSESYNADGERTEMTDGTGTSTFTYDSLGRMTSATDGAGATTSYGYDLDGHLTSLTYPNGRTVTRTYDAAGNLISVTDWQGHATHFRYDADSNLSEDQFPGNVTTQLSYDDADRLTSITDAHEGGTLASFDYTRDPDGLVGSETADNGTTGTTDYSYDALDQLTSAGESTYGYDVADDPTTFGAATQTFDPANELQSSSTSSSEVTEHTGEEPVPNGGGSTQSGSTASSQPSTSGSISAPGSTSTPDGSVLAFNASSPATDGVVSATSTSKLEIVTPKLRTRGAHDLVLAFVSAAPGQRALALAGDHLHWSRLAHASGPGGVTEAWQAHATARLDGPIRIRLHEHGHPVAATVAAFAGQAPAVVAHAAAQGRSSAPSSTLVSPAGALLWAVGHSGGQTRPIAPHAGQRLIGQRFDRATRTDSWVQELDTSSASAHIADTRAAGRWTLLVVAIGAQPARVARIGGASQAGRSTTSERSAIPVPPTTVATTSALALGSTGGSLGGRSATRAAAGHVASDTSATVTRTFAYNARGDRVEEATTGSAPVQLSYDQADRLIAVGTNVTYAYNGDGLRVSKTVDGTTTEFVWNEATNTPELLQDRSTYYIYGPEGVPIEQITDETPAYLHQDQQGSTRLITDADGNAVGRYDYDAWGAIASHTGTVTTNLQFDGQYADAETGFLYLRARYYDPSTGQFLTRDPAASDTRSAYGYADDDPTDLSDPSGFWAVAECGGASGAAGAGAETTVNGDLCYWTGFSPAWKAVTFTPMGGRGYGLDEGTSAGASLEVDWSATSPQDLAGWTCAYAGSVHALAGLSISVDCNGDGAGISGEFGDEAGASGTESVGATDVLWSTTGYTGWGNASIPFSGPGPGGFNTNDASAPCSDPGAWSQPFLE
jgi:RHS repeat-associated protein